MLTRIKHTDSEPANLRAQENVALGGQNSLAFGYNNAEMDQGQRHSQARTSLDVTGTHA